MAQEITDYDIEEGHGPLLFGRVLDGNGGGTPLRWRDVQHWKPEVSKEVIWIHLNRDTELLSDWLQAATGMPEPTAELLVSDDSRPRAFREGKNTLVAILRGINFNIDADPEDMVSMQLWSDGRRIITLRSAPMQTPRHVMSELDAGLGPEDAGRLITDLVEVMIVRMSRSIVEMNAHIDKIEVAAIDCEPEEVLGQISAIRRYCLALKRHMSPQHEALERIAHEAPDWFEDHDRREIAESVEHLKRYLDDIDISKESALVLQDEMRARALARSEAVSYKLTMVAGIFLPLTFLTGLLGINVGGMPGVDDWRAFWIVVVLCVACLVATLFLFRKWKWL